MISCEQRRRKMMRRIFTEPIMAAYVEMIAFWGLIAAQFLAVIAVSSYRFPGESASHPHAGRSPARSATARLSTPGSIAGSRVTTASTTVDPGAAPAAANASASSAGCSTGMPLQPSARAASA
jgi:hypothetical protein